MKLQRPKREKIKKEVPCSLSHLNLEKNKTNIYTVIMYIIIFISYLQKSVMFRNKPFKKRPQNTTNGLSYNTCDSLVVPRTKVVRPGGVERVWDSLVAPRTKTGGVERGLDS